MEEDRKQAVDEHLHEAYVDFGLRCVVYDRQKAADAADATVAVVSANAASTKKNARDASSNGSVQSKNYANKITPRALMLHKHALI